MKAEAGYSLPSLQAPTLGRNLRMGMLPEDFAHLDFTEDPLLKVGGTGIVEKV